MSSTNHARALAAARARDESVRQRALADVRDALRVTGVVEFAHRTDAALERAAVRAAVARASAAARARVDARRAALAALLEAERRQNEADIEATFESPEAAKARCVAASTRGALWGWGLQRRWPRAR